jgi:hypothetical protein
MTRRHALHTLAAVRLIVAALMTSRSASGQSANAALIKLTYRCGNYFRARNANASDVVVQYAVYRTAEMGTLTLPAAIAGIGYSDTYFTTTNRGAVLITYNGNRVAQKPNGGAACSPLWTQGQWSDTASWPIMAVNSSLLPNGKVLSWGREHANQEGYTIPPGRFNGIPTVWDPVTNTFQQFDAGADFFCSGQAFMPDGRLVQMGGHSGVDTKGTRTAYIFDYRTNTWAKNPNNMADGRWYPTVTPLASGEQLVISGTDTVSAFDSIPEVLQANGTFRELTGATRQGLGYFPFMFQAPDGRVFYAGSNPSTYFLSTTGTGGNFSAGIGTGSVIRDYGSAVMYDVGKIIIMGGGHTEASAEVIDLTQASPAWRNVQPMTYPRRQMNAVIMANGKIMASGGSAGPDFNPSTNIALVPEIWDPATELWTQVVPMKMPRLYHSETVLLQDGRILSDGGGQPAAGGLTDNYNAEIYTPGYLFNPDGTPVTASRPIIQTAPASITYGSSFPVQVLNAPAVAKVLWIRLSAVTHSYNHNQREMPLPFTQSGHTVTVTAPANANIAPPGDYLLIMLNGNGVPSAAVDVRIG